MGILIGISFGGFIIPSTQDKNGGSDSKDEPPSLNTFESGAKLIFNNNNNNKKIFI